MEPTQFFCFVIVRYWNAGLHEFIDTQNPVIDMQII